MGRSTTPTYRVETTVNKGALSPFAWHYHQDGCANEANLEKWRQGYNKSFQVGGVNGPRNETDVIVHISSARLVRQSTNMLVAEVHAPAFEII
jgi:hypothetical protein